MYLFHILYMLFVLISAHLPLPPILVARSHVPYLQGKLELTSESLHIVSSLPSKTQLLTATHFYCGIKSSPSRLEFSLASIQTSYVGQIIQVLSVGQGYIGGLHVPWHSRTTLGLGDLRPCLAFSNLCVMRIEIKWKVDLMDSGLVTLASACLRLECLTINEEWGGGH